MKDFKKITEEMDYQEIKRNLVEKVKLEIQERVNDYEEDLLLSLINCESPIEQLMAIELKRAEELLPNMISDFEFMGITPQAEITINKKTYRVDFLIEFASLKLKKTLDIVVECDGHEFHEKTKEQVKRDNERTRTLQAGGYEVLRFSGSEIYNNSASCGREVRSFIYKKCYERSKEV